MWLWLVTAAFGADGVSPLVAAEALGRVRIEELPAADAQPVVIAGGTVLTATGVRYAPGFVVLKGGAVDAVGAGLAPAVPGAVVIDATGRTVTPGLIDTHSHLGVYPSPHARAHGDGNEATKPSTPGVWAEHSVWPQDPGLELAIAGGITALQILPGSANLIGGQGFVAHVVPARGARAMRFDGAPLTVKMACGENPKRVYGDGGGPSTRMGNLHDQREAFLGAKEYQRSWVEYAEKKAKWDEASAAPKKKKGEGPGEEPDPPDRDLDAETLVALMDGRAIAQVHCYRADDMMAMMQVADEMGFEVRSFHHALEAYKVRDVLAARGIAVSTWADWWGFKLEAYDGIPENIALLEESGGRPVVHSDSAVGIQRLNQEAGKALASGRMAGIDVDEDDAIRWITANPAYALGIDGVVGTLEAGKRADVVVWDGDPFSVYTRADLVFVGGLLRYDRTRPAIWSDFMLGHEVTP